MARHFIFRQNDTAGSVVYVVESGLGATISTAATVFCVRNEDAELVFDDGVASIGSVTTATDGTKGATFTYPVTAETTANYGNFWGHFTVTYSGGTKERVPEADGLTFQVTRDYAALADETVAAGITPSDGFLESQAAHGFTAQDLVYLSGAGWALAQADDSATLAAAIVLSVPDVNSFRIAYLTGQEVTIAAHGLGAATTPVYLSATTAGLATATVPTSGFIQQIGTVKDANTLILWSHPAEVA